MGSLSGHGPGWGGEAAAGPAVGGEGLNVVSAINSEFVACVCSLTCLLTRKVGAPLAWVCSDHTVPCRHSFFVGGKGCAGLEDPMSQISLYLDVGGMCDQATSQSVSL